MTDILGKYEKVKTDLDTGNTSERPRFKLSQKHAGIDQIMQRLPSQDSIAKQEKTETEKKLENLTIEELLGVGGLKEKTYQPLDGKGTPAELVQTVEDLDGDYSNQVSEASKQRRQVMERRSPSVDVQPGRLRPTAGHVRQASQGIATRTENVRKGGGVGGRSGPASYRDKVHATVASYQRKSLMDQSDQMVMVRRLPLNGNQAKR